MITRRSKPTILFVDDDQHLLAGLRRSLHKDFLTVTESDPRNGVERAKNDPAIAVAVFDMRMPEMDGIEVLGHLKEHRPDIIRIMLTGNNDIKTAIDAVNSGHVFRFLLKPCEHEHLKQALNDGVRQHQLEQSEKELLKHTLTGAITLLSDIL